jgi:hypothetical protein
MGKSGVFGGKFWQSTNAQGGSSRPQSTFPMALAALLLGEKGLDFFRTSCDLISFAERRSWGMRPEWYRCIWFGKIGMLNNPLYANPFSK